MAKVTLDEIFARKLAERKAEMETPEYAERERRASEKFARDEIARKKWEAANPISDFDKGKEAAIFGERTPPDDIADPEAWLAGFDEAIDEVTGGSDDE